MSEQIPVAIVNNQNEKMNVDAVELDNSKLGRVMAKHLLELGHRKGCIYSTAIDSKAETTFKTGGRIS